jgi:hypothetical protein
MKEGNLIIKITCVYCRPVLPSKQGCLVLVLLKHKRANYYENAKRPNPSHSNQFNSDGFTSGIDWSLACSFGDRDNNGDDC